MAFRKTVQTQMSNMILTCPCGKLLSSHIFVYCMLFFRVLRMIVLKQYGKLAKYGECVALFVSLLFVRDHIYA